MRKGWYRGRDVILRVFDYGELPAEDARARKLGLVWAKVFEPSAGGTGSGGFLHVDAEPLVSCEPITQSSALDVIGLDLSDEPGLLLEHGDYFSNLDIPPADLAAERRQAAAADPLAQNWVCVDVDYLKKKDRQGGRQFNQGKERPIQGWVLRRATALTVSVRPDLGQFNVLGIERFAGPSTARHLVDRLTKADRVLGHNLLSGDYQAIAQIVTVSPELVERTVDISDALLQLEYSGRPTIRSSNGLNLTQLLHRNTVFQRTKAPGAQGEWKEDPQFDCQWTLALWAALLAAGEVTTGRDEEPTPLTLDAGTIARLRGRQPCVTGSQWQAEREGEYVGHRALGRNYRAVAAVMTPIAPETFDQLRGVYKKLRSQDLAQWHAHTELFRIATRYSHPDDGIPEMGIVGELAENEIVAGAAQWMAPHLNGLLRTAPPGEVPVDVLEKFAVAVWEFTCRSLFEAQMYIYRTVDPVKEMMWPFVLECFDEHRAGAHRVARGEAAAVPQHYRDFMQFIDGRPTVSRMRSWLASLLTDPAMASWRQCSPAFTAARSNPDFEKLVMAIPMNCGLN